MIETLGFLNQLQDKANGAAAPSVSPSLGEIDKVSSVRQMPMEELAPEALSRIAYQRDPTGLAADRFRYLRMRLEELWKGGKLKKLLITSPLPQDGKSTLALNLATALTAHGHNSVLLVEADLYHPTLIELLELESGPGLAECLTCSVNPLSTVRRIGPLGWYLLPAGKPPENPAELLHGEAFSKVMHTLAPHFDWILIDSPPITLLTDALALARHADGTLLVVRAGQTSRDAVDSAVKSLGPKTLIGVVLNGVNGLERRYSKYYGSYRKPPANQLRTGTPTR